MTLLAVIGSLIVTGFHTIYFGKYLKKVKRAKKIIGDGMSIRKGVLDHRFFTVFILNAGMSGVVVQQALTNGDAASALFFHLVFQVAYFFMEKEQYIALKAIITRDELFDWQDIARGCWFTGDNLFYCHISERDYVLETKIIHEEYVRDIGETKQLIQTYLLNEEAIENLSQTSMNALELLDFERLKESHQEMQKELSERFDRLFVATGKWETSTETELRLAKAREQLRMLPEKVATKETRMPFAQEALLDVINDEEMPADMKEVAQKVFDEIEKKKAVKVLDEKREEAERTIRAAMLAHHVELEQKA
ncbi:hypothetical protein JMA_44010 (plasmid) [Jeotgalibacillus malaysiensis]|uniref:Uncharacterized protein n=1 Tax=Jeotgalibacillus malaysiensis TaxID=1508404 RepID=A0A0B5AYX8_9BACL|nr:hypothetical protein [Jeotgalibacillus malaysiensis]AJD93718.1 hypothetical protein JMA_44010 [Jeotgalibacillus malaysiensis]